jgi:hypothetical protein
MPELILAIPSALAHGILDCRDKIQWFGWFYQIAIGA